MKRANYAALFGCVLMGVTASAIGQVGSDEQKGRQRDWNALRPVTMDTLSQETVVFSPGREFLASPGIMRRDPSDVIRYGDQYYVWYTKVLKGKAGYPGGWCGTVWYAFSPDGKTWTEKGLAIDKGGEGAWDSAGTYTPNILPYQGKFYLAYTAMRAPFIKIPRILHRGHEAMVWKDEDTVGSMGLACGPKCYFTSRNGIDFSAVHKIKPLKAAGIFRADFEEGGKGARPTWGVAMGTRMGLCRFELVWPEP